MAFMASICPCIVSVCAWAAGLLFSLIVGQLVVATFLKGLRGWMGTPEKTPQPLLKELPPWLTGGVERLFFTILVGIGIEGYQTAMIGWLALKLATNWNHSDMDKEPGARAYALSALLAGLISMLFALLGGLITKKLLAGS